MPKPSPRPAARRNDRAAMCSWSGIEPQSGRAHNATKVAPNSNSRKQLYGAISEAHCANSRRSWRSSDTLVPDVPELRGQIFPLQMIDHPATKDQNAHQRPRFFLARHVDANGDVPSGEIGE